MNVRTSVKAGGLSINRCEAILKERSFPMNVKTSVKAGSLNPNRCESVRTRSSR